MTETAARQIERVCYLLHFERPLGRARHYLGITRTDQLQRRLRDHATGNGARLTRAAVQRGVKIGVVRIFRRQSWEAERLLKRRGNLHRLCPVCQDRQRPGDWSLVPLVLESSKAPPRWQGLTF